MSHSSIPDWDVPASEEDLSWWLELAPTLTWTWAKTFARDSMHPFHMWKVVKTDAGRYAVAIFSKNDGRLAGYAD